MARSSTGSRPNEEKISPFRLYDTLKGHTSAISSVKFSPNGKHLASCSYDKYIKIWSTTDYLLEDDLEGHKRGISDIAWSHDSHQLVSASDDKTLKIWDTVKGKPKKTLKGHEDVVFCACFNDTANLVLSGSDDETARLWDVRTNRCTKTFTTHGDRVTAVDFYQNLMMTSSLDGFCHIYDVGTGNVIHSLGDGASISYAKFTRNGRYILASSLDSTIRLWDYAKGKAVKSYTGHNNKSYSVFADFITGGTYVVSGSEDMKIYIWHLNQKQIMQTLEDHSDIVLCVDCHPSENIIASGGLEEDKTIKIWKSS